MHDGYDEDVILPDLVDDAVGETGNPAATAPSRNLGASEGKLQDAADRVLHFRGKLGPEPRPAGVVAVDRFLQLRPGRSEESVHHRFRRSRKEEKTSSIGKAAISPRS